jgi:hypothetical protein
MSHPAFQIFVVKYLAQGSRLTIPLNDRAQGSYARIVLKDCAQGPFSKIVLKDQAQGPPLRITLRYLGTFKQSYIQIR